MIKNKAYKKRCKKMGVYLDGAANTPMDPEVLKAMLPYMNGYVGNSHSDHFFGAESSVAVSEARTSIADNLGVTPEEVFFTSGATEGNNQVILGLALHELETNGHKKKVICSAIEHSSVLMCCKKLEKLGFDVVYVRPKRTGMISVIDVARYLDNDTLLVCVMAVNNETGVANPLNSIAYQAHRKGAKLLGDCTQALTFGGEYANLGTVYPLVDYMTFSAHKIYGPTGVGILIAQKGAPLYPILSGGSQENGLRGGTHNLAGIVGTAKAVGLLRGEADAPLYFRLLKYLKEKVDQLNSSLLPESPICFTVPFSYTAHCNIVSLNCSGVGKFEDYAATLSNYGVAVSAGAACDVTEPGVPPKPSHVLTAMGISPEVAKMTIRVSFTKYTTTKDIDALIDAIKKTIDQSLKARSSHK